MLSDLEVARIFRDGRIGRASQIGGKASDVAHILVLGAREQAPHHYIVLHPVAQRADRAGVEVVAIMTRAAAFYRATPR